MAAHRAVRRPVGRAVRGASRSPRAAKTPAIGIPRVPRSPRSPGKVKLT